MQKQRVETYLEPDTVQDVIELAKERGTSSSDVVRQAVQNELDRSTEESTDE